MVCFDTNLQICRYSTIGDLLESFFEARLESYEARRQKEMSRLKAEMVEADAKARFIRAVLAGTLELRRASDEQIVALMKSHGLPALSMPTEPEQVDAYEYLLRMRMDRVKANAVVEQEQAVMKATELYKKLDNTIAADLWKEDLSTFEASWQKLLMARQSDKKTVLLKKQSVSKGKK